jgi:hypothetical protein
MPNLCTGIYGTVGGYDADHRGFRFVAAPAATPGLLLRLAGGPEQEPQRGRLGRRRGRLFVHGAASWRLGTAATCCSA